MQLDIQFRGLDTSPALSSYAQRKLTASLERFADRITAVDVRIGDVNGPKGGEDKYCRASVQTTFGTVSVRKGAEDPYAAVHLAVEALQRAVTRKLERARVRSRRSTGTERRAS